jgi:hypothetical protein
VLGTSNCFLNVSADLTVDRLHRARPACWPSPSTPTASFAGQRVFLQHAVLEAVPGGFSFSNGVFVQF